MTAVARNLRARADVGGVKWVGVKSAQVGWWVATEAMRVNACSVHVGRCVWRVTYVCGCGCDSTALRTHVGACSGALPQGRECTCVIGMRVFTEQKVVQARIRVARSHAGWTRTFGILSARSQQKVLDL